MAGLTPYIKTTIGIITGECANRVIWLQNNHLCQLDNSAHVIA